MSKRVDNKKGHREGVRPARSYTRFGWRKRQLMAELREAKIKALIEGTTTGELCEVQP